MWVADQQDDKIYAYDMATKARDTGKDFNTLAGAGNNLPAGLWSDEGPSGWRTMWTALAVRLRRRCGHRPGRAGRPLQRHGRSELGQQRQLAEQHGGMAWSNHRLTHLYLALTGSIPAELGPDQPGRAVPRQQPVDRGDTGGVGGPDQPD